MLTHARVRRTETRWWTWRDGELDVVANSTWMCQLSSSRWSDLWDNETCCPLIKESINRRVAHPSPPTMVQTRYSPVTPNTMCSKMRHKSDSQHPTVVLSIYRWFHEELLCCHLDGAKLCQSNGICCSVNNLISKHSMFNSGRGTAKQSSTKQLTSSHTRALTRWAMINKHNLVNM